MAQYRSGLSGGTLSPDDIPRPGVARDPGVTMRPQAELLGNPRDPRGHALAAAAQAEGHAQDVFANAQRQFSRDMSAAGAVWHELAQRRQKAEDDVAVDRGQLMLNEAFEPLVQKKLNSPDTAKPDFLRTLDEELVAEQTKVQANLKESGVALSPDGQRRLEHAAMQLRLGAARRASVAANNSRVALLAQRADENIQGIARMAGESGDVDAAMTRVESTVTGLQPVLTPEKYQAFRERAGTLVLETAIEGHIRRGEVHKAQALVDRYTGFVKPDAGEVPKAVADAAKARGVDPAVALAIVKVESNFNPAAANPNSTARGLGQFTDDTARRLGLPEDASTWTVEQQAQANAALTADNIQALRRGLGAEPNPTDVYLAHFLGAPTAVRALKGEPGAKLADVLTADQIAANAGLKHKGKNFAEWDVGELYAWAQSRMGKALKDTNGLIDGRTVTAADATVPIKSAMQLGHKVHNAATAERSRLRVVIRDDLASIRKTGQPIEIDEVAAAHILPAGEITTWREDRESARAFYDATNDMAGVPDAEIRRRVEMLKPEPGSAGFARRQKLHQDVGKVAQTVLDLRQSDPAGSVEDDAGVVEAKQNYKPDEPATYAPVIAARLAAQDKVGIPEARRSPITRREAEALTEPLRKMLPGQERAVLSDLAATTRDLFGEHADTAFKYALRTNRVSRANTQLALQIGKRLKLGIPVSEEDYSAAAEADAWAEVDAADRALRQQQMAENPFDMGHRFYDPAGDINFMGQPSPEELGVNVPARAIVHLRQNPQTAAAFDKEYGAGTAKKILEKYKVN